MNKKRMLCYFGFLGNLRFVGLLSVIIVGCHSPTESLDKSPTSDAMENAWLRPSLIRYPLPPVYDKQSPDGVEIGMDDATGHLRIWHRNRMLESHNNGHSWTPGRSTSTLMNDDLDNWPIPSSNSNFRYRRIAVPVSGPYHDHYGMSRDKRWFIEMSEDNGKKWKKAKGWIINSSETIDRHTFLAYHPSNPQAFYISAPVIGSTVLSGVYETKDGGNSFELKLLGRSIACFAISQSNPAIMFAINEFGSIVKSENAGTTWNVTSQDAEVRELTLAKKTNKGVEEITYPNGNDFFQIAIDVANPEKVFVLSKKGLLVTQDGGRNWHVLDLGPGITTAVNSLVLIHKKPNTIYLGTWAGLFKSEDGGNKWHKIRIAMIE